VTPQPDKPLAPATRRTWLLSGGWALLGLPLPGRSADFPSRAITLVVPFGPGGIADITARAVADAMARDLGQAVVVENRPSAGGIVGASAVAQARPDGHTLLLLSNANAVSASLFRKLPYDTLQAFEPISLLGRFDLGIFVAGSARWGTLGELLAQARATPGKLTIGTIAVGSTQHLAAELFCSMTGIDALIVPYRNTPAVVTALRAGEVDAAFEIVGPMLPQLGALRALALTGEQRLAALPDVPTVQQSGVAGYEVSSWNGLAVPAGTPSIVRDRLHRAVQRALADPAVRQRLAPLGMRLQGSTPQALGALLASEVERWAAVIRRAGIEPQ
jgi:tripartite-type tricarboxylate transporter receptor subunit TctC